MSRKASANAQPGRRSHALDDVREQVASSLRAKKVDDATKQNGVSGLDGGHQATAGLLLKTRKLLIPLVRVNDDMVQEMRGSSLKNELLQQLHPRQAPKCP